MPTYQTIESNATNDDISVRAWAEKFNLHHELLPMDHRIVDPIDSLQVMHDCFDKWPKTKATWTVKQTPLNQNAIRATDNAFTSLPLFTGSYPIHKDSRERYTNPQYVHPHNQMPCSKLNRTELCLFFASLGNYSLSDLADVFNMAKQSVALYLKNRGISWGDERRKGQLRFARTMQTVHEWAGIPLSELARLFDVPRTTLCGWRSRIENPIPTRPNFRQ